MGTKRVFVPAQIAPVGNAAIVTDGVSGAISDKLAKLVVPVVTPAIPVADDAEMLPAPDSVDVA